MTKDLPSACPPDAFTFLSAAAVPYDRLCYRFHEKGGTRDAALQLGLDEYLVIKTLIFADPSDTETPPMAALMHGTDRVSLRKLERLSAVRRLTPCPPEEATALTGRLVGGISPFGLPQTFRICIQESIRALPVIYFNAGERGVIAQTSPACLDLLPALWGDIATRAPSVSSLKYIDI